MKNAAEFLISIKERLDQEIGVTDWMSYDQEQVWAHGRLTGDDGPIHNDPEWSAENTPFGGTVVQGSLLLSSLTKMAKSLEWPEGDMSYRMSYGYNRVRIITPIKTGQRFQGRFILKEAKQKSDTSLLLCVDVTLIGEGDERPAIVAEWLMYFQFNS